MYMIYDETHMICLQLSGLEKICHILPCLQAAHVQRMMLFQAGLQLLISLLEGDSLLNLGRIRMNDTYRLKVMKKPLRSIILLPDTDACQVIQFLPNFSHPKPRYCSISLDRKINNPTEVYVRYGKRTTYMKNCPFLLKSHKFTRSPTALIQMGKYT